MDSINKLNPQQKEAALHKDGPLLILAGAGSGKTSTMTHRIANFVKNEGISPYNILAVTFTNKAAEEMRDRVEKLLDGPARIWLITFHSACLRILRVYSEKIGYDTNFVIYDPIDQKVVVKNCVKLLNLDDKKYTPNYVLSVISRNKEKGKTAKDYEREIGNSFSKKEMSDIYSEYERTLKKNGAMDFDDLLMYTVKLFQNYPDVLSEYQERFKYIMVDEYQDTNYMQYMFVKLLAEKHNNICVVGDDDQCIYEWRGADISNILNFEKDFKNTKIIKLEQNYRSHANILLAANSVIERNSERKKKKLWTEKKAGDKVKYINCYDEKEEARIVAKEIEKGFSEGNNYRDYAVLYRTNAQSRNFEEAFSSFSIPYQVVGGLRYYDRKEIKDMMCYMRLVVDPNDDLSMARIINEPKRGIGGKSLEKISAYARAKGVSLFEILKDEEVLDSLSAKSKVSIKSMISVLDDYSSNIEEYKISEIYDGLLVRTGYIVALEAQRTIEAEGRIENLLEFKSVIMGYEIEDSNITMNDFMEKIVLVADIDNHDRSENAVTLMTLHSAKGLEFKFVFMPGMEEGLFPSQRSSESPSGIEEERRLCYVGMTRAMEQLCLLRAKSRMMYGRYLNTLESRFLQELDKSYIEGGEKIGKDTSGYLHGAMGGDDGYAAAEIIRPFDQLKRIKNNVAKASTFNASSANDYVPSKSREKKGDTAVYRKGDRVSHKKFGDGLVLDADGRTVTVMFDKEGKKKLASDIAPLTKLD